MFPVSKCGNDELIFKNRFFKYAVNGEFKKYVTLFCHFSGPNPKNLQKKILQFYKDKLAHLGYY